MIFQQSLFDTIWESLTSPCGPAVLPKVMTFRPGEMGARFQPTATTFSVQLATVRRAGLGIADASFYYPGAQGQGWDLAF